MAQKSITLNPGESAAVSFAIVPHEAGEYQVTVNGLTGSFVAEEKAEITNASWSVVFVEGPLGGYLVKASIEVSSPREFSGKLTVSLPGAIAKVALLTYSEWQTEIARAEENLARCDEKTGHAYETCVHDRTLHLERVRARPEIDGFYYGGTVKSSYDKYVSAHLSNVATAVDNKTFEVIFPQGISTIEVAFYIVADQTRSGEDWWEILYWGGIRKYSPTVSLYENTTLLHSVVFEDGIEFIIGEGERIISLDIPPVIESGSEYWASATLWLPYKTKMTYHLFAWLKSVEVKKSDDIIDVTYQDVNTILRGAYQPLDHTGEYIARGIWTEDEETIVNIPALAVYREYHRDYPLPLGTYKVISTLRWRSFTSSTKTSMTGGDDGWVWKDVDSGIIVEII